MMDPLLVRMASTSSNTSSSVTQALLWQAAEQVQIRAVVEETMRDLLLDVEWAHSLQNEVLLWSHQQQEAQRLLQQQNVETEEKGPMADEACPEAVALRQEQRRIQTELADQLVQQLSHLERKMNVWQQIEQEHEQLLLQYDQVMAQWVQTQEELEFYKQNSQPPPPLHSATPPTKTGTTLSTESLAPVTGSSEQQRQGTGSAVTSDTDSTIHRQAASTGTNPSEATLPAVLPTLDEEEDGDEQTRLQDGTKKDEKEESPTVVEIVEPSNASDDDNGDTDLLESSGDDVTSKEETVVVGLLDVEEKVLMNIFSYLDALDILNTAQVNISMYSRVDSLFGLGGGVGNSNSGSSTTSSKSTKQTNETNSTSSNPTAPTPSTSSTKPTGATSASSTSSSSPTAGQVGTTNKPTTQPAAPSTATVASASGNVLRDPVSPPRPVATMSTKPPPSRSDSAPFTSSTQSQGGGGPAFGLFSLLQSRGKAMSPPRNTRPSQGGSSSSEATPMTSAMAASMAAKLSDGELNAILQMTKRLKEKEMQATRLMQEKEQWQAKHDGTEAVKQFLIAKVRDMEEMLSSMEDNETKVARQIASDQEVISFLDQRVQELEREVSSLQQSKQEAIDKAAQVQAQADQKMTLLGDMLQFERDKNQQMDREYKATRKLLVKEIKQCRGQVSTLQAELEGYHQQNESLRQALTTPGIGRATAMSSPHSSHNRTASYTSYS